MSAPDPSRKAPLAALVLIAILLMGGIWLQRHLRANSLMEDCLMAGRHNCAPLKE